MAAMVALECAVMASNRSPMAARRRVEALRRSWVTTVVASSLRVECRSETRSDSLTRPNSGSAMSIGTMNTHV